MGLSLTLILLLFIRGVASYLPLDLSDFRGPIKFIPLNIKKEREAFLFHGS